MGIWHVWGDYLYTRSPRIGAATLRDGGDRAARKTAEANGFDFESRTRNGFEPWAGTFDSEDDERQEQAFAGDPVVRGWAKV